jgi:hypothetical protein
MLLVKNDPDVKCAFHRSEDHTMASCELYKTAVEFYNKGNATRGGAPHKE